MLKITELKSIDRNELTTLEAHELQDINGGLGYDNLAGAAAGALGGGIGQVTSNYLNNQPLENKVIESSAYGAAFGFVSPVSGVLSFVGGVSKSIGGTLIGSDLFNPPPAVGY